jgi:hypothetical protein
MGLENGSSFIRINVKERMMKSVIAARASRFKTYLTILGSFAKVASGNLVRNIISYKPIPRQQDNTGEAKKPLRYQAIQETRIRLILRP